MCVLVCACVCVCVQDVEFFMHLATLFLSVPSQTFRIKCQMLLRDRKANDCNQKQLTTMLCIRTKVCTTARQLRRGGSGPKTQNCSAILAALQAKQIEIAYEHFQFTFFPDSRGMRKKCKLQFSDQEV